TSLFRLFFNLTAPTVSYTLSLHDALPICAAPRQRLHALRRCDLRLHRPLRRLLGADRAVHLHLRGHRPLSPELADQLGARVDVRSEEHTSELQSRENLVCRLLLEKKKKIK